MSADDRQIGGNHYKTSGEEHWTRMYRLFGPGYFIGSATKYIERYQKKDGIKDLQKALHFVEKLIELEEQYNPNNIKPEDRRFHLSPNPIVEEAGTEVKPTGWWGYTFEGTDGDGTLFTCEACRGKFRVEPHVNPNDIHDCAGREYVKQ